MGDIDEAEQIIDFITRYPYEFSLGYDEAESDVGRSYDDWYRGEAYDLGRQLRRSYLFGIKGDQ